MLEKNKLSEMKALTNSQYLSQQQQHHFGSVGSNLKSQSLQSREYHTKSDVSPINSCPESTVSSTASSTLSSFEKHSSSSNMFYSGHHSISSGNNSGSLGGSTSTQENSNYFQPYSNTVYGIYILDNYNI